MTLYNPTVLDHFQNPRNLRELKNPSATGMGASRVCGDVMTLYLEVKHDKISSATFTTMGCGAAIASGSIMTGMLQGKTIEEAEAMGPNDILDAMGGLPNIKLHCPDLAIEALRAALKNLKSTAKT